MTGDLILLVLAALPLMGSPGPATLSLAAMGAAFGAGKSANYLFGIILGTAGVLSLIAVGVTGLILAEPALTTVIGLLAAAYILYLAYRIATAPVIGSGMTASKPPSFAGGFLLAIANPKAYVAIGAVYSGNILLPDNLLLDTIVKIATLSLVILLVNSIWLYFGALLARVLRNPTIGRIVNILFAVMLVASVALSLLP
ncbi:LysE family transporter [uncultured Sneathiella sp.]|jgi:threonine/homoserine/homoserine lactone efflux protein|uniref:LysE family translocator n=1 Tax=uncultured Sneathiella sp. TaxID=879315 RepID=UPI0030D92FC1|tara:strand:+ start:1656 stop:2252 length:597 start_codon:yes stop_codon:yes gene_type:complete